MEDDFKLQPKHYYIVIAFLLFLFTWFAVDTYTSLTYEDQIGEINLEDYFDMTNKTEQQIELYYEIDSPEVILYHEEGVYDKGWGVLDG